MVWISALHKIEIYEIFLSVCENMCMFSLSLAHLFIFLTVPFEEQRL